MIIYRYDKLKQEFEKNPHQTEGNTLQEDDDPLSQSSKVIKDTKWHRVTKRR